MSCSDRDCWLQAFDELLLLKRGGRTIYNGPTGRDSCTLVEYFQGIQGVPKLVEGINPATWMLEVSALAAEERMGVDFADVFADSEANAYALPWHPSACVCMSGELGPLKVFMLLG